VSVVEIDKVVKRYGSVTALGGVSLTFADGELFGLLGPSGSGKTTLLRAIAGFVKPDKGQIRLDGRDVGRTPVHRREIGMVFRNYALFPHLNVFENVAFGLSVRGTRKAEQRKRVDEILSVVRLAGMERRNPRQLAGSSSASPLPAPSSPGRSFCSWTNRSARPTSTCASRCGSS